MCVKSSGNSDHARFWRNSAFLLGKFATIPVVNKEKAYVKELAGPCHVKTTRVSP